MEEADKRGRGRGCKCSLCLKAFQLSHDNFPFILLAGTGYRASSGKRKAEK